MPFIGSTLIAPFIKYYREELALKLLVPLAEFGSFDVSTGNIKYEIFMRIILEKYFINQNYRAN